MYADIQYSYPKSNVIRVACIYGPPNTDTASSLLLLRALYHTIAPLHSYILTTVMGDFNLTKIDLFTQHTVLKHSAVNEKLLHFSQRCDFSQIVLELSRDNHITNLVFFIS